MNFREASFLAGTLKITCVAERTSIPRAASDGDGSFAHLLNSPSLGRVCRILTPSIVSSPRLPVRYHQACAARRPDLGRHVGTEGKVRTAWCCGTFLWWCSSRVIYDGVGSSFDRNTPFHGVQRRATKGRACVAVHTARAAQWTIYP